jgi:hypothetical protein
MNSDVLEGKFSRVSAYRWNCGTARHGFLRAVLREREETAPAGRLLCTFQSCVHPFLRAARAVTVAQLNARTEIVCVVYE